MKITLITVGKIKEKMLLQNTVRGSDVIVSLRLSKLLTKRRRITQARLLKMQSGIKKANES